MEEATLKLDLKEEVQRLGESSRGKEKMGTKTRRLKERRCGMARIWNQTVLGNLCSPNSQIDIIT